MQKWDFETYHKCFRDFKNLPKFSETHVFRGTIRHPSHQIPFLYFTKVKTRFVERVSQACDLFLQHFQFYYTISKLE